MGLNVGRGAIEAGMVEFVAGGRSHDDTLTSRCPGLGVYRPARRDRKLGSGLQSGGRCRGVGGRALAQIEFSLFFARNLNAIPVAVT